MTSEPTETQPRRRRKINRRRLWIFRLIALVVLPALIFLSAEIALRASGFGYPTSFLLPTDSADGRLQDNYKFAWRFFPRSLARSSQPILVSKETDSQTTRIIVFGGSAAMGDPEAAYGFPRVLQALLSAKFPDRKFEVINAAVTAINSHVVFQIAKDCRQLNADAWVVYMGNNEVHGPFGAGTVFGGNETPLWLIRSSLAAKRTKIGQFLTRSSPTNSTSGVPKAWGGLEMFLEHQVAHDDPSLNRVYAAYRENLKDTIQTATSRNVPVVVSTVVSNLKDSAPFSSLQKSFSEQELTDWKIEFERADSLQNNKRFAEAAAAYARVVALDPGHADSHFRLGASLFSAEKLTEAQESFATARDLDTLRFRADSKINAIVAEIASNREDDGVYYVDAVEEFTKRSPQGIVGTEFLYEHVHFNFSGNYLLAQLVAERICTALQLPSDGEWPTEKACADLLGVTPFHERLVFSEVKGRLSKPPFNQQSNYADQVAQIDQRIQELSNAMTGAAARDAATNYEQLLEAAPHDWVLRKQFATMLESMGKRDAAIEQWQMITRQLPHYADGFFKLGILHNQAKQWKAAKTALDQAIAIRPNYARALNSLGICNSHLGKFADSFRSFGKAVEIRPTFAEAYVNWALVLLNQEDEAGAVIKFRSAIEADPKYLPARMHLGKHFVAKDDLDSALPHYEAIAELAPHETASHVNLGFLLIRQSKFAQATASLERALQIDPTNSAAKMGLQRLQSRGRQ